MEEVLLTLLEKNAKLTCKQLAAMLNADEKDVEAQIEQLEQSGIIKGYHALIDWEKTDRNYVVARIELKVTPKADMGFEDTANTIAKFEEVEDVFLMSGGHDIAVTLSGKTFKDVALFVAERLAPIESIQSTTTHFVLRKYKERGVIICGKTEGEERQVFHGLY